MKKEEIPDDADGDAIRNVMEHGSDLSKVMKIDFMVTIPNESSGNDVAEIAAKLGFNVSVEQDSEGDEWTCYCTKEMLLTYEGVQKTKRELSKISLPFGGYCDDWGTFGNNQDG